MTESLVLYTNPMSRGRIVRWMLEETGARYRTELVAYGEALKSAAYLRLNPMGKVPTLVQGETVITECAAICAWLADVFPQAGLAPPPAGRAAYYRWLFFAAGPLEAAVADRFRGIEPDEKQQRMLGYGSFGAVMNALEDAVSGTRYIAGDRFSAADVYVGAHIGWGLQFSTLERRPALVEYWERISDRDAHRRAAALDDQAMAQLGQAAGS